MTIILPILQFAKQLSDDHEGEWAFDDDDSGNVAESFDETKIKRDREGQFAKQEGRSSAKSDASAVADKAPISDGGPESSGDPKKPRPIDTPEFKRWFGKSKVVDGDGEPLVVYHGTHAFSDFESFHQGRTEQGAIFFSESADEASEFASPFWNEKARVFPVYLKSENPLHVDFQGELYTPEEMERITKDAIDNGHDGIVVDNIVNFEGGSPSTTYVVFDPAQIKSATSNRGTYDPKSRKINESSTLELSRDGQIRQITTRPVARESQGMTLREAATGLAQALVRQSAPPEPDRYRDAVVQIARRVSEFCNVPAAVLLQRHIDPAVFGPWKPRALKAQESVSWQRAPDVLEDWTPYRGERGGTGWQWNGQGEPRYQEEKPSEPGGESSNIQPDPANKQEAGPVGAAPAAEKPEGGKMKVQRFKRNTFAPAEEQSADEMAQWLKPGHLIVAGQDGGPMHKTFDPSSPVTIKSRKIGAELPQGTVVDKRIVHDDDGIRVEYLVKPRSKDADSEFADKKELARLQELLDVDPDAPTEHRNKLRQQIADIQSRLERPKATPKSPTPVAQKPAEPDKPAVQEKPKPASKPQPRELTELEKLKGQAKTLQGLLDRGASGKLGADYAARLEDIQKKIKSLE